MFFDRDVKADRLPGGSVCLTYDDGPGPHTLELGSYLAGQGVRATFFLVGKHAEESLRVVDRLHAWGHRIGNHTWSHPGLVALHAGGDVVGELVATDRLLAPWLTEDVVFFRAPYGNWRRRVGEEDLPVSPVAEALNRSGQLPRYVGPINWDIVAEDWECWRRGIDEEECCRRYLAEAERVGGGIVLMHDSSEEEALQSQNRTMQMTKLLVPPLKERGFRFIDLAEVPQIRSAVRVSRQVALGTSDGRLLARADPAGETFAPSAGEDREAFGVVELAEESMALRAGNGCYLSLDSGGEIRATAPTPEGAAVFRLEGGEGGGVALRTRDGAPVAWGNGRRRGGAPAGEGLRVVGLFRPEAR
jgi:peptidoglycan/xylan/chitin deacetylase (PgdA/CDA1 family)